MTADAPADAPAAAVSSADTVVLDTSVLLADPKAFERFDGAEVVLPVVVVAELEAKRNHLELGWAARAVLRQLEELRVAYGNLAVPVPLANGSTLRVELNHRDVSVLPEGIRSGSSNDTRILAVAAALSHQDRTRRVVVVTKDLPLRLRASVAGLEASDLAARPMSDSAFAGVVELDVARSVIDGLHADGEAVFDDVRAWADGADVKVANVGLVLRHGTQSALARVHADRSGVLSVRLVRDRACFELRPRGARQRLALDLLCDDTAGAVSLGGRAGTGKSALALAAGHIRGRSLTSTFAIVDEAQNLEKGVLLTALSRMGEGSKVVLTHDVAQRDNLRVGRHDGVAAVVEALKGQRLFGHVTLDKAERSPVAEMASRLLDDLV